MPKIAIVGVGNLLMGDDGIGVHVIQELQNSELPPHVEIYDGMTNAFLVLECIDGKNKAIIIDACRNGGAPGTVYKFRINPRNPQLKEKVGLTLHDMDFVDALKSGEHAYNLPKEIVIIGVEPEIIALDLELSPALRKAVPRVMQEIKAEL